MARVRISLNAARNSLTREIANQATKACAVQKMNQFNEERRKHNAFVNFCSQKSFYAPKIDSIALDRDDVPEVLKYEEDYFEW